MALEELVFTSANGRDTVYGWIYSPVVEARAIVQVMHGLGEHSRRYLPLLMKLVDAGCVPGSAVGGHTSSPKTSIDLRKWAFSVGSVVCPHLSIPRVSAFWLVRPGRWQ